VNFFFKSQLMQTARQLFVSLKTQFLSRRL